IFIPAVLAGMKPTLPRAGRSGRRRLRRWNRPRGHIAAWVMRHKAAVILFFTLLAAGGGLAATAVGSRVDILGYFSPGSEPRVASDFMNRNFGGFNPLNVYLKAKVTDPAVLKVALLCEAELTASGKLPAPSGIADVVAELNNALTGFNTIPESAAEVENLLFFVEGNPMIDGMLTPDRNETLMSVLVPSFDNTILSGLFTRLDAFLDGFRRGIMVEPNRADHPILLGYERLLIGNLLTQEGIKAKNAPDIVAGLSRAAGRYQPRIDPVPIRAYLTSDEAELILDNAEADRLAARLVLITTPSTLTVREAIEQTIGKGRALPEAETAAFAQSIVSRMTESAERDLLSELDKTLLAFVPALKAADPADRNYALAPFLWKSLPVPSGRNGAAEGSSVVGTDSPAVRFVPVERFEITGTAKLMEDIRSSIFGNQLTSILVALVAVFLLNTLVFRSLKDGLVSLTAIGLTIVVNFGVMGLAGIPLDFVTAIIAGVAIGTGIDYTIHFMARFSRERVRARTAVEAYRAVLVTTGRAIVYNALAVALGFLVLVGSNVVPMRTAGILLASTMATSSLAALTLLPVVMTVTGSGKGGNGNGRSGKITAFREPIAPTRPKEETHVRI
ncbi:MAG TPA: hypothetical protein ENN69_06335, partial [Spirochaetia bacterium]|nr:hypothetical protein [Spirochaetia bacterium]